MYYKLGHVLQIRAIITNWGITDAIDLFSATIYLFKINNRNTRKTCEIYSKLTIKTPERRQ